MKPKEIENKKIQISDETESSNIIPQIKNLFNHYSNNSLYLSKKQFNLFLIEASLLDDQILTSEHSDTLFYSFSYAKESITFNLFLELIIKISNIKFPEIYKENQTKALYLLFDEYINPLINIIFKNSEKKVEEKPKKQYKEKDLSFNDINHKLVIKKISSLMTKEIIEENYLLFLKIYQKYFCFENLKISRTQKNHLSQKAFIKVMDDFNISPEYLNSEQIEEIFNRVIDNKDYTENIMNELINIDLCNNDGMWFTLFHFIVGIYLIAIFNVMISNYDENDLNNIYEVFVNSNDSQAFENIIKLFYKSSNLKKVMPEEIRKMQMEILNYKNKDIDIDDNTENKNNNINPNKVENSSNEFLNKNDDNKIIKNNNNNINYNYTFKNNINKDFNNCNDNEKEALKSKSSYNYYNDNSNMNKSDNINKNRILSNYANERIKRIKSFNLNKNKKNPISNDIDLFSKINLNQKSLLLYTEMAPFLVKKYKKELISVYKCYSELYLETIFSIYMTQNGFINLIKDLNLLVNNNIEINYQNLPAHQKFLFDKKRVNLLDFSAVNLIFSKFSSIPAGYFVKEKGKAGNKRINFLNFIFILLNLANKIFNPKFNNISFDNKQFSYDNLTNTKFPIKYAYNFVSIYIIPLYKNILPLIEEDNFSLNNLKILLENERLNPLVYKIIPLFIRILKCYNDNKDYVEYSQYFKCLSDFNIFPDFVQRTKMIKIFINFIDDFDDIFLLQGNNKIVSQIEECAFGILYIALGGSDSINITTDDIEIKLLNFMQVIAQSQNLGKISILNLRNTLQKDFLNTFYEIQNYILGESQDDINDSDSN